MQDFSMLIHTTVADATVGSKKIKRCNPKIFVISYLTVLNAFFVFWTFYEQFENHHEKRDFGAFFKALLTELSTSFVENTTSGQ